MFLGDDVGTYPTAGRISLVSHQRAGLLRDGQHSLDCRHQLDQASDASRPKTLASTPGHSTSAIGLRSRLKRSVIFAMDSSRRIYKTTAGGRDHMFIPVACTPVGQHDRARRLTARWNIPWVHDSGLLSVAGHRGRCAAPCGSDVPLVGATRDLRCDPAC
jgi:hypothetical protein